MAVDSIKINLELATEAAERALKNVKKNTEEANSAFNIFKGTFAAGLAIEGLKAAYSAVTGAVNAVIGEAAKAEQSVQNMNVALRQAGLYSENTSQELQDFADELERITIYSGDAAESSIALFAALTNLDKNGIKSATVAATDLAATLNIDLVTASEMIAKAVNGNVTAFNKLGIEIQKGNTDSERLRNTLSALEKQQGSAAEASNTYAGAQAKLQNQQEKFLETIGKLLILNPSVIEGINSLATAFANASSFVEQNSENIVLLTKSMAASIGIVAAASAAWVVYSTTGFSVTLALVGIELAARKAWIALGGPVALAAAGIALLGVAIYGVVKYWDDLRIAAFETMAVLYDYDASFTISETGAKRIRDQAQALRDKADAIRIAQVAETEAENQKKLDKQNEEQAGENQAKEQQRQKELEELRQLNAEKVATRRLLNSSLLLADQELDLQLEEQKTQHEQRMFELSGVYDGQALQRQIENDQANLLARQEYEQQALNASIEAAKTKALLVEDSVAREKALREASAKAEIDRVTLTNKQAVETVKLRNKAEEDLERQKLNNKRDTWSTLLTLQNSSNKELAMAGKAFALYDIAVQTPIGISKALAAYPPPFNFAAAALVGAAFASQAAAVAGLNFEKGGIVPGTSYTGDRVTANVNSREMILTTQQQAELFKIANGKGGRGESSERTDALLSAILDAVKSGTSININGREIINVVRDGLSSGRSLS